MRYRELAWMEQARCVEVDPDLHFPEKGHPTAAARRICFRCEVRAKCLAYALANPELLGVWGGLSVNERRKLRQEQEQAA